MAKTSQEEWAELLDLAPNPHPFQSWHWGEFKSRWGWRAHHLHHGRSLALVLQRRLGKLPLTILYVPKGPILDYGDGPACAQILGTLEQLARRENAVFVKIDPDVPQAIGVDNPQPDPVGAAFSRQLRDRGWQASTEQIQFRNTVEIDLTLPESALLAALKQKTRYNIRLASRKGVVVRPCTVADLPTLLAMYVETARRDGFSIRPANYYLDAWQSFSAAGTGHALLAEYVPEEGNSIPLAGLFILRQGTRAIYWQGASTGSERQRMPNYLLQWEAIRWAKEQGCLVYDMWGAPERFDASDPLWGVWRFKSGFNGRLIRHVGAWDYVNKPLLYWFYQVAIPKYLDLLRRRPS